MEKINLLYQKHEKSLWCLFFLLFIVLSYRFFGFALESSLDMQWYPTMQFWGIGKFDEAINPYLAHLNGDVFMANGPNYMPLLYILMLPFGYLEWQNAKVAFAFCNFFCFLLTLWVFYRHYENKVFLLFCFSLVILGYTYGNVVSNAQTTIWIGLFISVAYFYRNRSIVLTLALSMILIKHSIGIPVLFGFFLAGYRKEVICALLLMFGVICLSAWKFGVNPFEFMKLMLEVNALTYTSANSLGGPGDLISLSQKIFHKPYSVVSFLNFVLYISFAWIVWLKKPDVSQIVASSVLLSLFSLPHLGYDYYLLVLVLLFAGQTLLKKYSWGGDIDILTCFKCVYMAIWIFEEMD